VGNAIFFKKKGPVKHLPRDKLKKKLFWGVVLLFALAMLFFVLDDSKEGDKIVLNVFSDKADIEITNFHFTEVGDPELIWEIDARGAQYMRAENVALFDDITVKLTLADGRSYLMTGRQGTLQTDTKDIDISGDVSIVSDEGGQLGTDHLKFSHSERRIYTEEDITMENAYIKASGKGMTLSLKDRRISLLSNVDVIIDGTGMIN
jgi:LPS export ABC transporter protein LptC